MSKEIEPAKASRDLALSHAPEVDVRQPHHVRKLLLDVALALAFALLAAMAIDLILHAPDNGTTNPTIKCDAEISKAHFGEASAKQDRTIRATFGTVVFSCDDRARKDLDLRI